MRRKKDIINKALDDMRDVIQRQREDKKAGKNIGFYVLGTLSDEQLEYVDRFVQSFGKED